MAVPDEPEWGDVRRTVGSRAGYPTGAFVDEERIALLGGHGRATAPSLFPHAGIGLRVASPPYRCTWLTPSSGMDRITHASKAARQVVAKEGRLQVSSDGIQFLLVVTHRIAAAFEVRIVRREHRNLG